MTTAATANMPVHTPPSLRQRAGFAASLALAAGAFLIVGGSALAPDSPLGAITLLGGAGGAKTLAVAVVLAATVAGVATVLAGRRLVDVGTFAACIGLALTSLRGGTSAVILIAAADGQADGTPAGVAMRFAFESAAWLLAPLAAMIVSALVHRRLFARPRGGVRISDDEGQALRSLAAPVPSPSGVVDPVAVVVAPPTDALEPGKEVSLVLWGRPPGATAHARGLPAGVELVLHRETRLSDALDGALARLDPSQVGDVGSTDR